MRRIHPPSLSLAIVLWLGACTVDDQPAPATTQSSNTGTVIPGAGLGSMQNAPNNSGTPSNAQTGAPASDLGSGGSPAAGTGGADGVAGAGDTNGTAGAGGGRDGVGGSAGGGVGGRGVPGMGGQDDGGVEPGDDGR